MGLKKITEADLTGRGVIGMADTPNLSARRMQEKVEEVVRSVVIPVMNENAEKTATKQDLADAVFNSGAGDMQADFYDKNADGIVNRADNGLFVYTQSGNVLSGSGVNGKFKAVSGGTYTAFTIDGQSYSVQSGGENEIELTAGVWYTFVLDVRDKTINFNGGGGLSNSKLALATAEENTVLRPYTFYAKDKELKTGNAYSPYSADGVTRLIDGNDVCEFPGSSKWLYVQGTSQAINTQNRPFTFGTDYVNFRAEDSGYNNYSRTVDLTNVSRVEIVASAPSLQYQNISSFKITTTLDRMGGVVETTLNSTSQKTYTLDTASLSGVYNLLVLGYTHDIYVHSIKMYE